MHPLEQSVYTLLSSATSLKNGDRIIIGFSGGPDSTSLIHILSRLSVPLNLHCTAVYVDHGLRPEETPDELEFVTHTTALLGVGLESVAVDTRAESACRKISVEHAARELRYGVFEEVRVRHGADWIIVGHNADDQVEELLIRLLRGSSRKALSGMAVEQNLILRPLLRTAKSMVYDYLKDKNISYCTDSSNSDPVYLRNRIRRHLLPLLEDEYDSGIRKALLKTAENLGEDEDYLHNMVDAMYNDIVIDFRSGKENKEPVIVIDRQRFTAYHKALQRRCAERILWQVNSTARYEHILAVMNAAQNGTPGKELHLTRGLRVQVTGTCLVFSYPVGKVPWRGSFQHLEISKRHGEK